MSKKFKRKPSSRLLESDDPESDNKFIPTKEKTIMIYLLDQEEINRLINASDTPYKGPRQDPNVSLNYPTYAEYEVLALLGENYTAKKLVRKKS